MWKPPRRNPQAFARGKVDFDPSRTPSNHVQAIDGGAPITILAGVHVGCFELFAQGRHPQHHRPEGQAESGCRLGPTPTHC